MAKKNSKKIQHSEDSDKISPKDLTQIVYLCQVLSFLFGFTAVIGVIILDSAV